MMELNLTMIHKELTDPFDGLVQEVRAIVSHDSRGFS